MFPSRHERDNETTRPRNEALTNPSSLSLPVSDMKFTKQSPSLSASGTLGSGTTHVELVPNFARRTPRLSISDLLQLNWLINITPDTRMRSEIYGASNAKQKKRPLRTCCRSGPCTTYTPPAEGTMKLEPSRTIVFPGSSPSRKTTA